MTAFSKLSLPIDQRFSDLAAKLDQPGPGCYCDRDFSFSIGGVDEAHSHMRFGWGAFL
jgi:hypothetical protein